MRSPSEMDLIQIEVTNKCHLKCANCTRFVSHVEHPFIMPLDQIEESIKSLDGFKGNIGLMGGEPTLHPKFSDILAIYRELIPDKERRQLWTAGHRWEEYKKDIQETFYDKNIAYNDHSKPYSGRHQPLLVSIDEVIDWDDDLKYKFINNCWIQNRWSASINQKGAYICEVAAAMSTILDDDGAMPTNERWWEIKTSSSAFITQVDRYCRKCSGCLPFENKYTSHSPYDLVSPGNVNKFKVSTDRVNIADLESIRGYIKGKSASPGRETGSFKDFPEWHPWNYRDEVFHEPGEGDMTVKEVRRMQS